MGMERSNLITLLSLRISQEYHKIYIWYIVPSFCVLSWATRFLIVVFSMLDNIASYILCHKSFNTQEAEIEQLAESDDILSFTQSIGAKDPSNSSITSLTLISPGSLAKRCPPFAPPAHEPSGVDGKRSVPMSRHRSASMRSRQVPWTPEIAR